MASVTVQTRAAAPLPVARRRGAWLELGGIALLLALIGGVALGVVHSTYHSRQLYRELSFEQQAARDLQWAWRELQLEKSAWYAHARIDRIARSELGMEQPSQHDIVLVRVDP